MRRKDRHFKCISFDWKALYPVTVFLASVSQVSSFTIVLTCSTDTFIALVSMKRRKVCIKTTNVCLSINNEDSSANSLECHLVKIARYSKFYNPGRVWINIYESKLSYQIPELPLGISAGNTRRKAFLLAHGRFQL